MLSKRKRLHVKPFSWQKLLSNAINLKPSDYDKHKHFCCKFSSHFLWLFLLLALCYLRCLSHYGFKLRDMACKWMRVVLQNMVCKVCTFAYKKHEIVLYELGHNFLFYKVQADFHWNIRSFPSLVCLVINITLERLIIFGCQMK